MIKNLLNLCSCLVFVYLFCSSAFGTQKIHSITFAGNNRVEESTIKNYLNMNIGEEYTLVRQNRAIHDLHLTGLFEAVDIKFQDGNLSVTVTEAPLVSKVSFIGNNKIKESILSKECSTVISESLSSAKIESDVQKIKEIYKKSGRFATRVDVVVKNEANHRASVAFQIQEGPKTSIKKIYFVGNVHYSDDELRSAILTKESRWFRFLETSDTYDPDRIEYDKELLRDFYQSVGFADCRVISATAELSRTKEYFTLTFAIDEGERYNFGNISVINKVKGINDDEIKRFINIKTGKLFNAKAVDSITEKISVSMSNRGYPNLDISTETEPVLETKQVNVQFILNKAHRFFIDKIDITGNLKTRDHVIRRQYKIAEGDVLNKSYLEKGEQNLRNLDYFEKISTKISPTSKSDRYNVSINLEEKSTASIGFGTGYNTASGLFGSIDFLEKNLIGTGNYLSLSTQISKRSTSYYMGVTNPHFLGKDLSFSTNLFYNNDSKGSGFSSGDRPYDLSTIGIKNSFGYNITEYLDHEVDYTLKREKLTPYNLSSIFLREQAGKCVTSSIGHSITYTQLDSRIVPKNGYTVSVSQEFAGVSGDNRYLRHEIGAKYFISFINNKVTVKLGTAFGNITGSDAKGVRISDRFNLGDYTLRGFAPRGVGPRDMDTKEALGGQNFYNLNAELHFPVGLPSEFNVTGLVFVDCGNVWDVKLGKNSAYNLDKMYDGNFVRASVGFGFIWVTRIAPIRMDWGFPIRKKSYDDVQNFHLKFSTHF